MSKDPAETRADTAIIPAVTGGTRQAITCGGCREVFACAAFGGAGLFLAETLRAAALTAGWQQDGDAWTCTVCLAKADTEPEPEPEPAAPEPEPATDDPIAVSAAIIADYDERVYGFWEDMDRSNHAAELRVRMRLADAQPAVAS